MALFHGEGTSASLGEIGYEAYGNAGSWLTFDGRRMPRWPELAASEAGMETRRRWEEAAKAILGASPAKEGS